MKKCQCESSVCDHSDEKCIRSATEAVKTPYGTFQMCNYCAIGMREYLRKEEKKMTTMVTRAQGGTAERQVDISQIQVPDLWHIYEKLNEIARAAGVIFDAEPDPSPNMTQAWKDKRLQARLNQTVKVEMTLAAATRTAQEIYECWILCHDLKNHIATYE